jgi:hypothetical protein
MVRTYTSEKSYHPVPPFAPGKNAPGIDFNQERNPGSINNRMRVSNEKDNIDSSGNHRLLVIKISNMINRNILLF